MVLAPATRRQEASKLGQAFCEQFGPTVWISSRSALARACGVEASTCGAKPGRTVSAAATNAATAMAERALIMTVPCHYAFAARFVALTDTKRPFRDVFARSENGFIPPEFCFVADGGTKQCQPAQETHAARKWFRRLRNIKTGAFAAAPGTGPACRAARGGVDGAHAPYCALSLLPRPPHPMPPGLGAACHGLVRPPSRRQ